MFRRFREKAPTRGAFLFCLALLVGTASASAAVPLPAETRVAHVIDGDTVVLPGGRLVRLPGINSPELGRDGAPDEPLAAAARDHLARLIAGKSVRVIPGREAIDRHGRALAYLLLSTGEDVQELLIRAGLAVLVAIPPNLEHVDRYRNAEAQARAARRGIWGEAYFAPVPAARAHELPTGFRFVHGQVERVVMTETFIYLALAERFAVRIPRRDWHYFGGEPWRLKGRDIEVRGWVSERGGRRRVTVSHPAMLRVLN